MSAAPKPTAEERALVRVGNRLASVFGSPGSPILVSEPDDHAERIAAVIEMAGVIARDDGRATITRADINKAAMSDAELIAEVSS